MDPTEANSTAIRGRAPESNVSSRRQRPALARARRFVLGSRVLLWGVALVVVVVSLPLLKAVAIKENELDALRALRLLGPEVFAAEGPAPNFNQILHSDSTLGRRLPDTRLMDEGRVMFHHGYLFEIVPLENGERLLRAWPLVHGQSGLGAFWCDDSGAVLGHPNDAAEWSGVDSAPLWPGHSVLQTTEAGWRALNISASRTRAGI
jgi:hypothetical protein